jgi:hypothetical protein
MRLFIKREWGTCRYHGKENERALEMQTQEMQKLVDAMNNNVAYSERIANNTA